MMNFLNRLYGSKANRAAVYLIGCMLLIVAAVGINTTAGGILAVIIGLLALYIVVSAVAVAVRRGKPAGATEPFYKPQDGGLGSTANFIAFLVLFGVLIGPQSRGALVAYTLAALSALSYAVARYRRDKEAQER